MWQRMFPVPVIVRAMTAMTSWTVPLIESVNGMLWARSWPPIFLFDHPAVTTYPQSNEYPPEATIGTLAISIGLSAPGSVHTALDTVGL